MIEWTNVDGAAALLGVTPTSVRRWINDGRLPAYKIGRVLRVKVENIDSFLEASRVTPGPLSAQP